MCMSGRMVTPFGHVGSLEVNVRYDYSATHLSSLSPSSLPPSLPLSPFLFPHPSFSVSVSVSLCLSCPSLPSSLQPGVAWLLKELLAVLCPCEPQISPAIMSLSRTLRDLSKDGSQGCTGPRSLAYRCIWL